MLLHQQIAQQRHHAGLSQHGLALAVDVTVRTVARWEAGEATPDLKTLRRIAKAIGATITIGPEGTTITATEEPT